MGSIPYMPFYPANYASSTINLSRDENSSYIRIICALWQSPYGDGSIDDDDRDLMRLCGFETSEKSLWRDVKKRLLKKGFLFKDPETGRIRQKRLDRELDKARRKYDAQVAAGRTTQEKFKQKKASGQTRKIPEPDPGIVENQTLRSAKQELSSSLPDSLAGDNQNQNQNQNQSQSEHACSAPAPQNPQPEPEEKGLATARPQLPSSQFKMMPTEPDGATAKPTLDMKFENYEEIKAAFEMYNELARTNKNFKKAVKIDDARAKAISVALKEHDGLDEFRKVIDHMNEAEYLNRPDIKKGERYHIDWMLRPDIYLKLREEGYDAIFSRNKNNTQEKTGQEWADYRKAIWDIKQEHDGISEMMARRIYDQRHGGDGSNDAVIDITPHQETARPATPENLRLIQGDKR